MGEITQWFITNSLGTCILPRHTTKKGSCYNATAASSFNLWKLLQIGPMLPWVSGSASKTKAEIKTQTKTLEALVEKCLGVDLKYCMHEWPRPRWWLQFQEQRKIPKVLSPPPRSYKRILTASVWAEQEWRLRYFCTGLPMQFVQMNLYGLYK